MSTDAAVRAPEEERLIEQLLLKVADKEVALDEQEQRLRSLHAQHSELTGQMRGEIERLRENALQPRDSAAAVSTPKALRHQLDCCLRVGAAAMIGGGFGWSVGAAAMLGGSFGWWWP